MGLAATVLLLPKSELQHEVGLRVKDHGSTAYTTRKGKRVNVGSVGFGLAQPATAPANEPPRMAS